MKHHGNVTKINGAGVEPVDIITFGSPCQDLSVAGKRAGIQAGERSNLFFEAVRIIKEMREATNGEYPKYAVWENVPGAFSSNKGHDFHAVLEALCSVCDDTVSIPKPYDAKRTNLVWDKAGEFVGDNYSVAWRTLDAQYWGVPQRRKRIYIVADFAGGRAGEILFKPDSLRGDLSQGNEAGQGATADAVGSVDGSVGVFNESGIGYWMPGYGCLRAEGENRPSRPTHTIVQSAGFCQGASPAAQTIGYQEEIAPTIKGAPSGTAPTMTGDHQNRITDYTAVAVQEAKPPRKYIIRRLLPVECARLQGFPDEWSSLAPYDPADAEFWEDVRKTHAEINGKAYKPCKNLKKWYEGLHTDSAEYKMWGNGIALPNARYVLQGIAEHGAKTLGSLFDGSGGFPLAGVLNGITPVWCSEIEPYPIAVTVSRFGGLEMRINDVGKACRMGAEVLRAQEKEPCEWCKHKLRFECYLIDDDGYTASIKNNIVQTVIAEFCPMCGRPLTKEATHA